MITSDQIRAARALLRWSAKDLADRAGISLNTVQRMEASTGSPRGLNKNLEAVREVLVASGIELINQGEYQGIGGYGVRLKEETMTQSFVPSQEFLNKARHAAYPWFSDEGPKGFIQAERSVLAAYKAAIIAKVDHPENHVMMLINQGAITDY